MSEKDKIIARLNELGIVCWVENGQLIYKQDNIEISCEEELCSKMSN